jgi:hypothetical protein
VVPGENRMRFEPKSADEIALDSMLPEGIYPFEVMQATDKISQAGNEMIELKLVVFGDGSTPHVFDYLLEKLAYKLRHFAETTGLLAAYEAGELTAEMCLNRDGYCKLAVEKKAGYEPRNTVKDYVPRDKAAAPDPLTAVPAPPPPPPPRDVRGNTPRPPSQPAPQAAAAAGFDDDLDIPFS